MSDETMRLSEENAAIIAKNWQGGLFDAGGNGRIEISFSALNAILNAARAEALTTPSTRDEVGPVAGEVKPVAWPETLDWSMVDSGAICHWRASFGDYVLDVVQGHDLVWAYRVNNTGRMNFDGLESATAAAVEDLRGRLLIRWAAAQKTMRLYAAPPAQQDDALRIAVEALEPFADIAGRYLTGGLRADLDARAPALMALLDPRAFYAARKALDALKSTAGQEGGGV